jgi:hypothetical protein
MFNRQGRDEQCRNKILVGKLKGRDHMRDIGVDGG